MKKQQYTFECDLCGDKATDPKDWTEISIECRYVDRMWYDKTICPHCVKLILAAVARQKSLK